VLKQRPAGRDLSLTYDLADNTQSPDLPIFGRTAAHASQQQQAQPPAAVDDATAVAYTSADQMTPEAAAAAASVGTPVNAKAGAAAGGDDEDTTGQLYSSLIHSNMDGMSSRDVDMQEDQAAEPGELCSTSRSLCNTLLYRGAATQMLHVLPAASRLLVRFQAINRQ
jgi:hypothetical protein